MSLRTVATEAGISHGFLADLEKGRRNASDDVCERLGAALRTEAAPLITAATRERVAKLREQIAELEEQAS